jgi:hypothetical protein
VPAQEELQTLPLDAGCCQRLPDNAKPGDSGFFDPKQFSMALLAMALLANSAWPFSPPRPFVGNRGQPRHKADCDFRDCGRIHEWHPFLKPSP